MRKKIILFLILPFIFISCGKKDNAQPQQSALPVEVAPVIQQDVPETVEWIGTTDGYANAQIRAQVQGYLISRDYKEGSLVKTGDLLFALDARPYQAALEQAKGDLAQAQADFGKTELDVKRYTPLAKEGAISQQELDDAIQANLANQAKVATTKAAVDQAQVNLDFTKITSPIDGIVGIAQAQIGDLVGPAQGAILTTVSTVNPIKVYFPISEQQYIQVSAKINAAEQKPESERLAVLELVLADGTVYPEKGKFGIADRQIDPQMGTMKLSGIFPNPGNILRPGQYAKIRFTGSSKKGAILVPQRAVMELQGTFQVAVVDSSNVVHITNVKAGQKLGSLWVITEGLKLGDQVVVEGLQKVKDGMTIKPIPVSAEQQAS